MAQIQIGQWSSAGQTLVDTLETDGGLVFKAVIASIPQMATVYAIPIVGSIVSSIVGYICDKISLYLVQTLDRAIYAGFVAIRVGKQVSDYVKDQQSGNESQADQDADNLISVGKT